MNNTKRFFDDSSANVAMIFGIAALPTLVIIGAGVDYSRAVTEKTKLQIGTDAAVLVGIQAARRNAASATVTAVMQAVIQANDTTPAAVVKGYTLSPDGTTLCVDSTSQVTTALMSVVHVSTIPVGAHACSKMNIDTYEVALAVDNSGSMSHSASNGQTKIEAARTAAKGLVSALTPTNSTANITASFSLVPFAASVNIGSGYNTAAFMDKSGQSSIHWENVNRVKSSISPLPKSRFDLYAALGVSWGGCVEARPGTLVNDDTPASTANANSLYVPMFAPDEADNNYSSKPAVKNSLNDYLVDTGGKCTAADATKQPNAQTRLCKYYGQTPHSDSNTYYNAFSMLYSPNMGCTTTALSPLDATASDINTALDAMAPSGDTTELEGVMWAWRTISPNGPFTTTNTLTTSGQQNPRAYNYTNPTTGAPNHKVIILLTDGEDHWVGQNPDANGTYSYGSADPNKSIYSSLGFFGNSRLGATTESNARTLVDNATIAACTNAKSHNIEIYTVGLLATDGIDTQGLSLLSQCATDSNHSYVAQDGDQLVQAFQAIAATLSKPRIAT